METWYQIAAYRALALTQAPGDRPLRGLCGKTQPQDTLANARIIPRERPQPASADPSQLEAIRYFAKISSTRLNAFSAAACGVIPPVMMSAQPTAQTCSFWTWA
jgi:hypothetical protein